MVHLLVLLAVAIAGCAFPSVAIASASSTTIKTGAIRHVIASRFPRALTNQELVQRVTSTLYECGYDCEKTILASSLCCDELNRVLERDFGLYFGDHFSMGGLAGFPFGGITSFGAMAHHIPDGGSCLIVFGPHVGVEADGSIGSIQRRGKAHHGNCCGSAHAALNKVKAILHGESPMIDAADLCDPLNGQQNMVAHRLLPYAKFLLKSPDPMVKLPLSLYDSQRTMMDQIVASGCQEVGEDGKIALLGGIQINTPGDEEDYFVPLCFEIRSNKNEKIADLLWTLEKRIRP